MRRVSSVAAAATVAVGVMAGLAEPARAQRRYRVRRRPADRGRRPHDRERNAGGGRRQDRPGRRGRRRARAGRRRAREPRWQDRDADADRHPRASQPDARSAHARLEAARLLRRERRTEHGHRQYRAAADARRDDPRRRQVLQRRTRDHHAGAGAHHDTALDHHRGGRPQGGAGARAQKVDIVKIWVDTRDGKYKKLPPEFYAAIIEEAHKHGLRVSAHIFDLEDAKGLIRAGLDAFAHGVRDKDIDDELIAMFKQKPSLILTPNLPDRGVKTDLSWMRRACRPPISRRSRPPTSTGRRRRLSTAFRRATWRSSTRRACASRWEPTATGRGARTRRCWTW